MARFQPLLVITVIAAVVLAAPAQAGNVEPIFDLDEVLMSVGVRTADLEVGRGRDWLGSASPSEAPFLLHHLPEVFARPERLVELGNNLLEASPFTARGGLTGSPLFGALTVYALQPRLPSSRGTRPALIPAPDRPGSLTALLAYARARPTLPHGSINLRDPLFDLQVLPPPGAQELALPEPLRAPVVVLLEASLRASAWIDLSWRGVPTAIVIEALEDPELTLFLPSGERWWPAVDRAANHGDDEARAYAAGLIAVAAEMALAQLELTADGHIHDLQWKADTAIGSVIVAGSADDLHACDDDCLLLIDLGGNDHYIGSVGAGRWPAQPVSLVIDLAGHDRYLHSGVAGTQGSGNGGVGFLIDAAGNDIYDGSRGTQGHGMLGYGVLWDRAGDDLYSARSAAQGSAVFGSGLLLDSSGDDRYQIHGDGQGFGGPRAVGCLLDLSGDDSYRAEPNPDIAGRPDPHTDHRTATSNAQGAGVGRRGDLSNGHAWAGGIGLLVDASGDDNYRCGSFCQAMGYWYGTGMLLDRSGNDTYRSVYFSQGSALHQGAALLLDLSGSDVHWLGGKSGASLGYGWDLALGMMLDGGGDDIYRLRGTGLGAAERRSLGLFSDSSGCDTYRVERPSRSLGFVDRSPVAGPNDLVTPSRLSPQAGLFLDLGGSDTFERLDGRPVERVSSPGLWILEHTPVDWQPLNLGAGIDLVGPGVSVEQLLGSWTSP